MKVSARLREPRLHAGACTFTNSDGGVHFALFRVSHQPVRNPSRCHFVAQNSFRRAHVKGTNELVAQARQFRDAALLRDQQTLRVVKDRRAEPNAEMRCCRLPKARCRSQAGSRPPSAPPTPPVRPERPGSSSCRRRRRSRRRLHGKPQLPRPRDCRGCPLHSSRLCRGPCRIPCGSRRGLNPRFERARRWRAPPSRRPIDERVSEASTNPTKSENERDGGQGLHPVADNLQAAHHTSSRELNQGVQVPEVGVPGDWVGRGFTSTGYGSIG